MSEPTQPTPAASGQGDGPAGGLGEGERYRFESHIATGGMGEVWLATDTTLGREVAVKVLKSEYAGDPAFRSRFETEARNAAALHHPNVASVFDFGELPPTEDGTRRAYLVMELVRGEPLSALLRAGQPMPAATAADLLAQAADALAAAHDLGIVHRDVKPANLLVTADGTVKITDFGIARAANAVALTQTGQVVGTPQYLSPEQAEGRSATAASDIYSLGVVLYECLAGRRPFDGDSPIATALAHLRQEPPPLPEDVPEAMRETVRVALAKDPADRFASVRDLAAALRGESAPAAAPATAPVADDAETRVVGVAPVPVGHQPAGDDGEPSVLAPAPYDEQPPRRRLPGWLPWVVAAAVVLLAVVVLTRLDGRGSGTAGDSGAGSASPEPSTSATRSASRSPSRTASASASQAARVGVDEGDYLGRPVDEARAALEALGLRVDERRVANPGGGKEQGTVADVSPSGKVTAGSTITLSYFGAAPTPTSTPSSSPTATRSPPASQSPTASASPTASPSERTGAQPSGPPSTTNGTTSGAANEPTERSSSQGTKGALEP